MIAIVNLNIGNILSIANIIKKIGGDCFVCSSSDDLNKATKIIIPGVGSFDHGANALFAGGWIDALNNSVLAEKKPDPAMPRAGRRPSGCKLLLYGTKRLWLIPGDSIVTGKQIGRAHV